MDYLVTFGLLFVSIASILVTEMNHNKMMEDQLFDTLCSKMADDEDDEGEEEEVRSTDYIKDAVERFEWKRLKKNLPTTARSSIEISVKIASDFRQRCIEIVDEDTDLIDWETIIDLEERFLAKFKKLRGKILSYASEDALSQSCEKLCDVTTEMKLYLATLANQVGEELDSPRETTRKAKDYVVPDDASVRDLHEIMEKLNSTVSRSDPLQTDKLAENILDLYCLWKGVIEEGLVDEFKDTGSILVGLARNYFELYRMELRYSSVDDSSPRAKAYTEMITSQCNDLQLQFERAEAVIAKLIELSAKRMVHSGHDDEKTDVDTWNTVLGHQLGAENLNDEFYVSKKD